MYSRRSKPRHSMAMIDIFVIIVLAMAVFSLSQLFDIFNYVESWVAKDKVWDIDDLVVVAAFLIVAMCVFAFRRYREVSTILKERELTLLELRDAKDRAEAASKAKGEFL